MEFGKAEDLDAPKKPMSSWRWNEEVRSEDFVEAKLKPEE